MQLKPRYMRKLVLIFLSLHCLSCEAQTVQNIDLDDMSRQGIPVVIGHQKDHLDDSWCIDYIFNHTTTLEDVIKRKNNAAKRGVLIDISKLNFDMYGKLIGIEMYVRSSRAPIQWTQALHLNDTTYFGIRAIVRAGIVDSIAIGRLKKLKE